MVDEPLKFHGSFDDLLDIFQNIISSITWLNASVDKAIQFFKSSPYVIELDCSVTEKKIKVSKSIFKIIEEERIRPDAPLYSQTLISYYRIFTIAIKDIIWEEDDFQEMKDAEEMQFLRHLRNACAHDNRFYWGTGRQRTDTINKLPISWRNKTISSDLEGSELYMNFMSPGDIFILLNDISNIV